VSFILNVSRLILIFSNPSRLPVRTIVFLAGPHRGLNVTAMQTLVKGQAAQALVDELAVRSRTLNEINQRFAHIAGDIEILTCYETKPTKTAIQVSAMRWTLTKGTCLRSIMINFNRLMVFGYERVSLP